MRKESAVEFFLHMRGSFILHLDPSRGVINICAVAGYNTPHGSMRKEVEREGIFTLL